jgi:hypothetical protein
VGLPVEPDVSVVVAVGEPPVLVPPPVVVEGGSVVVLGGGVVDVGGLGVVLVVGGFWVGVVCGGGSLRGGGVEACVTTVVVVLPSGLTETTVVGALDDGVSDGDGAPPRVVGPPGVEAVVGVVCRPACDVPWPPVPPVPPAVLARSGPASSATAANAVATTSPATPSTTYPVRFGLLLFGGVSILVTRELESDPSGRGIQAPWGCGKRGCEVVGGRDVDP